MLFRQLRIAAVIPFILACVSGFAGTIKGFINDKQTGEPLLGAIVDLQGTSYGAVTGLDGSYVITDVPAGSYELEIKFTSYDTYTQHITVADGQPLVVNYDLKQSSHVLQEVQVTGKTGNGTDEQARNLEKNSDLTMNILSARTIELLPDITVANVMQRVSGVQMERNANGDARYATIRGMDKRYNYTTVDGIQIPSPDDKGRYVPLDIFPAEILDRVEVIKTLTPDMEGNAIGGVTNLVMKEAPDHLVVYATGATGYNENLFDEKYNSFGKSSIVPNDPTTMFGTNYTAKASDFPLGSSVITQKQAPANDLFSLSIGNRFLKNKKLGVMLAGSYQNTFKATNDIYFAPASEPNPGNQSEFDDLELRKYYTHETRSAAHATIDYRFNDKNSIKLYALYTQLDQWQDRYIVDTVITAVNRPGPGLGTVDYKTRTTFYKESIANVTLKGTHVLAKGLTFDWTGAASQAKKDVPDYTEFTTENNFSKDPTTGGIDQEGMILKGVTKSWQRVNDQDLQGFLNLTYNTKIFGHAVEFKAGGMYRAKNRSSYYNEYDLSPNSGAGGKGIPYTSVQDIDPSSWYFSSSPTGQAYTNGQTYNENEDIFGAYALAKLLLMHDRLEVLGGFRLEHTHVYDSVDLDPKLVPAVSGTYNYSDPMPHLHLKYRLNEKQNIRLSYYESISRPGFEELLSNTQPTETFDQVGNPLLNHSVAQNFDARYEFFPKGLDQLLIGAFFKNVDNPIEYYIIRDGPSKQEIQPQNGNNAINYGAEIQITKYFHYFGFSANYTYTHSAITVPAAYLGLDAKGHDTTMNLTETRPQQGQAANIGNLSLLYKNPTQGLDANLTLQYTGRFVALASEWQGLDYWQKGLVTLGFACEKRIVKHLSVYLKVQNILNTKTILEINESNKLFTNPGIPTDYFGYQNLKDGKILVEQTQTGRNYLVGIRYKFN